jgi:hypothetical protein
VALASEVTIFLLLTCGYLLILKNAMKGKVESKAATPLTSSAQEVYKDYLIKATCSSAAESRLPIMPKWEDRQISPISG